jgi:sugar transferase (PEP-CTERM system associated)
VIRVFKVYYPLRTLVLLAVETLIVWVSFVLGVAAASWLSEVGFPSPALLQNRARAPFLGLLAVTGFVLLLSHGFDLYDSATLSPRGDKAVRMVFVVGIVALALSALGYFFPSFFPGNYSTLAGLIIMIVMLFGWRGIYFWLIKQPFFRERVYVLGTGERAQRLLNGLRQRSELGVEVVGWTGEIAGELTRETMASHLVGLAQQQGVHRVIVAMSDRRGILPVDELLKLRLDGVKMEEATSWLEKISNRVEVEQLNPSWLIFADGFRFSTFNRIIRRGVNFTAALIGTVISLPLLPFIALAVSLSSRGPVFYSQERVGRGGVRFYCHKFRTMRQDAEADTGATWAADDDPRITRFGKFLRWSRLDEIPQLWCVLKGDMHFVGPRPERPEFVEWLSKEIPYYGVRHVVRPGITGWAQVQYKYGNTLDDAREKLQYDLFYIKNASVGLDFWIMFQTIKIVLLGRGAQ